MPLPMSGEISKAPIRSGLPKFEAAAQVDRIELHGPHI